MFQISAPHFVAGVIFDDNLQATRAAPILRYMVGWSAERVVGYARSKGWKVTPVRSPKTFATKNQK